MKQFLHLSTFWLVRPPPNGILPPAPDHPTLKAKSMMKIPNRLPRLFTIREAADILRVCPKTVRRLIKDGRLASHQVGGQHRITENGLEMLLSSSKN